ncbi:hypothetical protein NQ314_012854 [Rhamnusium bicolor]|uniref:Uncharacterized protein n=1 Tax=Rhamnusium bicolor TaxID=1586634 RepID=A0AAV8XAD7_9CUCU|nr:hypothetical protein NQ314_012854 [Rhamnusium bicolor]
MDLKDSFYITSEHLDDDEGRELFEDTLRDHDLINMEDTILFEDSASNLKIDSDEKIVQPADVYASSEHSDDTEVPEMFEILGLIIFLAMSQMRQMKEKIRRKKQDHITLT